MANHDVNDKIGYKKESFDSKIIDVYHLEPQDKSGKGCILLQLADGHVYTSQDGGKSWDSKFREIQEIYVDPKFSERIVAISESDEHHISNDYGKSFSSFEAPENSNSFGFETIIFHPKNKKYLLWTGEKGCENLLKGDCRSVTFYSTDTGSSWKNLEDYTRNCLWVASNEDDTSVICERFKADKMSSIGDTDNPLQLIHIEPSGKDFQVTFKSILGFTEYSEYIIVAVIDDSESKLEMYISTDGLEFAKAKMPENRKLQMSNEYTVLDGNNHEIFIHVADSENSLSSLGTLMKSNSNGTTYTMSLDNVNRNDEGFVDFERVMGLEGVIVSNVVVNGDGLEKEKDKEIRSYITFSDGAHWDLIGPEVLDGSGKALPCKSKSCSLHLHGCSERGENFCIGNSATSAVGVVMGIGNFGNQLGEIKDADTFMTRDGGYRWHLARPGPQLWLILDQGSVIALIDYGKATNKLVYSLDEGESWIEYEFMDDEEFVADRISAESSGTDNLLVVIGKNEKKSSDSVVYAFDFSKIYDRQCELDENDEEHDDFILWSSNESEDDDFCLFGHIAEYHRKTPGADCFVGAEIPQPHKIVKNCQCTRRDFECDYNFERANDGTCHLVPGLDPLDPLKQCATNDSLIEVFPVTGYRRLPLTTCVDGIALDNSYPVACPGKESEFARKHGMTQMPLFFIIFLPIAFALMISYCFWRKSRPILGQIRLGEGSESNLISPLITVISAGAAVAFAIQTFFKSMLRFGYTKLSGMRYPNRNFQYDIIDDADEYGEDVGIYNGEQSG